MVTMSSVTKRIGTLDVTLWALWRELGTLLLGHFLARWLGSLVGTESGPLLRVDVVCIEPSRPSIMARRAIR
jgi:hypothetical protein